MRTRFLPWQLALFFFLAHLPATAQTSPAQVGAILEQPIQPSTVTAYQLTQFLATRIPRLTTPANAQEWAAEGRRLRKHILDDIVFHGWPREWVDAPPKFVDAGVIPSGKGYRMRKLRYEIVPGFESTAILYEPEAAGKKAPAILNVNGHVGARGKSAEYKQKRCINFAKQGVYALNLEWLASGELMHPENEHDNGAHLDLVGANELGLFYLAMRRGLDYLAALPQVDSSRLGVTGLSGGGWQTAILGALDERVAAAAEVAGIGSLDSNLARPIDTDEVEEDATDLTDGQDYPHLVAMRAPRPTLLIHNSEDNCCFRSALVKPYIYDAVKPFFQAYGRPEALAWHENLDPGTHNYHLDNREAAYGFFSRAFNLPAQMREIPSGSEIKTYEELVVGLPKDNLTILGLAKKLAGGLQRRPVPTEPAAKSDWARSERAHLGEIVRYRPVAVKRAWRLANSKNKGLETISYRLDFENGLSATAVWLKAIEVPSGGPATLVIHDQGKKSAREEVSDLVNQGEQVLALDVLFTGDVSTDNPNPATYALKIATVGERPLGIEAGQVVSAAKWMRATSGAARVRFVSTGIRSQVVALVASALEPSLFTEGASREAMRSLAHLLNAPVAFRGAPDLFCLDLYKEFDIDRLVALAEPTKITLKYLDEHAK